MADATDYLTKGKRDTTEKMLEQAEYSIAIGQEFKEKLFKRGFPETKMERLIAVTAELRTHAGNRYEGREDASGATRIETELREAAKDFARILFTAAPMVLRDANEKELTPESFAPGRALYCGSAAILGYLDNMRPLVTRFESGFQPYFGETSPSSELERISSALRKADTSQKTKMVAMPEATAKLYELRGRVLELIEDLNRVGRIAFADQPQVAARFNKDILLRARRSGPSKSIAEAPTT